MKAPVWYDLKARHLNPRGEKIVAIVLHDTAGSGTHNDTLYLANPGDGRKVSVDFTVERNGSVWKLNPDIRKFCCNHAGRATKVRGLVNAQVNHITVGIEICQKADLSMSPCYTDAQVRSVATLCAWLTEELDLTTSDITTHRQIITDGSRSDPRKFPFDGASGFWACFWDAKGKKEEFVLSDSIAKTPDATNGKLIYTVRQGDTLSRIATKMMGKASSWKSIQKANALSGTLILPGQVLIIPSKI